MMEEPKTQGGRVLYMLKHFCASSRLWALDHLPFSFPGEDSIYLAKCFKYINKHFDEEKMATGYVESLRRAYARECHLHCLSDELRFQYMMPIILNKATLDCQSDDWLNLLCTLAASISDKAIIDLLFEKASTISESLQMINVKAAAAIINGLCSIGIPPPESLVFLFFKKQYSIRLILISVFRFLFNTYNAEFSETILRNTLIFFATEPLLIEAVIQISNPPYYALEQIKKTFVSNRPPREVVITFIKNATRLNQLNILNYQQLCDMAFGTPVFGPDNEVEMAKFYCHCLLHVSPSTIEKLFIMISDNSPKKAVEIAKNTISQCPELTNSIITFLCSEGAITNLKEWCYTYQYIMPKIEDQHASQLTQFLLANLCNEIKIGHITTDNGGKVILIPEMFQSARMQQGAVRGHREIASLLEAYSFSQDLSHAIDVVGFALTAHTFPLIFSIKMILYRLPEDTVMEFFEKLLHLNWNMKMMFLKLSEMMINLFTDKFFDFVLDKTIDLIFNSQISVVRCLAIRNVSQYQSIAIVDSQVRKIIQVYPKLNKLEGIAERETIKQIGIIKSPAPIHKQISTISSSPVIPHLFTKMKTQRPPAPKKKPSINYSGPITKAQFSILTPSVKKPASKKHLTSAHSGIIPKVKF